MQMTATGTINPGNCLAQFLLDSNKEDLRKVVIYFEHRQGVALSSNQLYSAQFFQRISAGSKHAYLQLAANSSDGFDRLFE